MGFDAKKNSDKVMAGYSEICFASPMARGAVRDTLRDLAQGIPPDLAQVIKGLVTILDAADVIAGRQPKPRSPYLNWD